MFDRTRTSLTAALLAATSWLCALAGAAEKDEAYALEVENASAKVGEPTEIRATLTTLKGHKVSKGYRNRLIELSAQDEGVTFEKPVGRQAGERHQRRVRHRRDPDQARHPRDQRRLPLRLPPRRAAQHDLDPADRDRRRYGRRRRLRPPGPGFAGKPEPAGRAARSVRPAGRAASPPPASRRCRGPR